MKKKKYPDGKGKKKKNVVYVPDLKTLEKERQARTDSTNSATEALRLKALMEKQSDDYEANVKEIDALSDEEYETRGDALESKGNFLADQNMETRKRINNLETTYRDFKGIEPSTRERSKFLGADQYVPIYSFPSTTVELLPKEEEKKKEEEEKKVEEKKETPIAKPIVKPVIPPAEVIKKEPEIVKPVEKKEKKKVETWQDVVKKEREKAYSERKKKESEVDYKGKIKYIPDAAGEVKYFFIDGSGRKIPLKKEEAERRQKENGTEIVTVMKNPEKKMPMGIKYDKGKKGKYVYGSGRKYALGAVLGSLAGKALGAKGASGVMSAIGKGLGGSQATPLGKVSNAFGMARDVTNMFGQYGIKGGEKANKISSIFNSVSGVTNTLDTSMKDKLMEKKEKINKTINQTGGGGMGEAIQTTEVDGADPETPLEGFRYGRMFPYGLRYKSGKSKTKKNKNFFKKR